VPHFLRFIFKQTLVVNLKKKQVTFSLVCLANKNNVLITEYSINVRLLKIKNKIPRVHMLMKCDAHMTKVLSRDRVARVGH
jgi:hypothetical protein